MLLLLSQIIEGVQINIGSCTYEIDGLLETIKKLGVPCNDNCNLPIPAQTYGFEKQFKIPDSFELPPLIKAFLNLGEYIHAKAKLKFDENEIACVELKMDYLVE